MNARRANCAKSVPRVGATQAFSGDASLMARTRPKQHSSGYNGSGSIHPYMAKPRFLQHDRTTDRQIWLLELDALPATLDWGDLHQQKFVCLCAVDASSISSDALSAFCSELVDSGCAYFCTWGPDCERVHDIMDERITGDNPPETDIGCLMTTWHPRESLAEAVDFFLTCTAPDEEYAQPGCPFGLAVVMGSPAWTAEMEQHLQRALAP